jgi:hypothetical protein
MRFAVPWWRLFLPCLLSAAALVVFAGEPARGGATVAAAQQPSSNVAVVPGYNPPKYQNFYGVPAFPASAPQVGSFHFSELAANAVTTAALAPFDTVVLYGIRWSDVPPSAQTAINGFARTGKVIIWDSDATGAQNYLNFVHPFSTQASGENGEANGSVVTYPAGTNFLASPTPASPYYLDPAQLVSDRNLLNDMNAMKAGAAGWAPALAAANKSIPNRGWAVAWGYGATGDHSGMVVYSGLDADSFTQSTTPTNWALKELQLELAAPFSRSADTSCAPKCAPPAVGGGQPDHGTFALCRFTSAPPAGWVRGKISLILHTSVANGITAKVVSSTGHTLGVGRPAYVGHLRLPVDTRLLPSNRVSRITAVVYVGKAAACRTSLLLRVDNVPPRMRFSGVHRTGTGNVAKVWLNEPATLEVYMGGKLRWHRVVRAGTTQVVATPSLAGYANFIATDRAGNHTTGRIFWR